MPNLKKSPGEADPNRLDIHEHFNLPQMLVMAVNANHTVGEWGRGTGKSTGAISWRMVHCAKVMPRMAGTFLTPSYRKFMDHQWPGIKKGFTEKFKLKEGRDYLFLKKPPEYWPRPYMAPGTFEHFVPFSNGSGWHIISQDHNQSGNSLDTDVNVSDEGKLLNGERAQEETYNTMRGNREHFGHLSEHYSKWIFSDKYTRADSNQTRWFADYKTKVDHTLIHEILLTLIAVQTSVNPRLINHLKEKLVTLQRKAVFYSEASTLDNIHAVGIEYIEGLAKTNSPYGILTSIFNMDVKKTDGNLFYPMFNEVSHTYNASDNNRVDELIWTVGHDNYLSKRSCELDTDHMTNEPLKLLLDLGGNFNWGVVAQKKANVVRCIKNFIVQKPNKLLDLADMVDEYYKGHNKKVIELYWPKDGEKEGYTEYVTDIDKFIEHLEKLGWTVRNMMPEDHRFISHKDKYDFGLLIYDRSPQRDQRFPLVLMNGSNCQELIWSVSGAQLVPGEIKYKKEKRGEKKNPTDLQAQVRQPHLSDALDWLAIDYLDDLKNESRGYAVSLHQSK